MRTVGERLEGNQRGALTRVAFEFPDDLLGTCSFNIGVVPGGNEQQMVVKSGSTVRILDRNMNMSSGTSFELPLDMGDLAASEQFLYTTGSDNKVRCLTHDGTLVASYGDQDRPIFAPVRAPGGLLFVVLGDDDDSGKDEIIALDAQTLQYRYRFGLSLLRYACGLVVIGEELFVCDRDNDRIQVFSLAGEHRRSITGEWVRPLALCFVKDRLYLVEQNNDDEDEEGELVSPLPGRRICVLSLQGNTLEVYQNPFEGSTFTFSEILCRFDGKLLAPVQCAGINSAYVGMVALRDF